MFKQTLKISKSLQRASLVAILGIAAAVSFVVGLGPSRQVAAATNSTINFQARLLTSAGKIVPDGFYNIEFKLYDTASTGETAQGACSGSCVWMETRTSGNAVRVVNGYLTVNLGSVTTFGASINWDQELWLTMNIGGTGTPSFDGEMTPRLKLTAVPYALRAGKLVGGSGANVTTLDAGTPSGSNLIHLPAESGTLCIQGSVACGFAADDSGNFILNQSGSDQTANFRIDGTGRAATAFQAPLFDTPAAQVLAIGTANATSINLNQNTAIAAAKTLTVTSGATSLTGASTGDALTVSNSTSAGNIAVFKDNATAVLTIADGGSTTLRTTTNSITAFQIQNSAGGEVFTVNTTGTGAPVTVGRSGAAGHVGTVLAGVYQATSTNTRDFGFSSAVPAGQTVIGALTLSASSVTDATITDSKGNVYTIDASVASGSVTTSYIFSAYIENSLTTSDTLTIQLASGTGRWLVTANAFDNLLTPSIDRTSTNTANNSSMTTGTSAVTTGANEMVFATFGFGSGRTFTPGAGYNGITQLETTAGSNDRSMGSEWKYVTATGAQEGTASLSSSGVYSAALATYKSTDLSLSGVAGSMRLSDGGSTNRYVTLGTNSLSGNRTILLPDESGTLCIQGSSACSATQQVANVYTSANSGNLTASYVPIDMNAQVRVDGSTFSHSTSTDPSEVTVSAAGWYEITYYVTTATTAGTSRSDSAAQLEYWDGASWTAVAGSESFMYNRQLSQGKTTGGATIWKQMDAGDKIRVAAKRNSGTDTIQVLGNAAGLVISGTSNASDPTTLQYAYANSAGGTTPEIKLDATRNGFDIQDSDTTIGASEPLFAVRSSNAGGLGIAMFQIQGSGAAVFRNSANSINAFQVQDAVSATVLNVDTSNGRVGVGGTASFSKFEVIGGDAAVYNSGNNPRLVLGDSTAWGENGYLQWDSANNYFRIESVGTNGLKINDNFVSIGNIFPDQPLKVGNGSTLLHEITTTGTSYFKTTTNSTTAFEIQTAAGNAVLSVDTSSSNINLGSQASGFGNVNITSKSGVESGIYMQPVGTLGASNIQYAISRRSNNTDLWYYGHDGSTYWNYLQAEWSTRMTTFNGASVFQSISNNDQAFTVKESGGLAVLRVDTSGQKVAVGLSSGAIPAKLYVFSSTEVGLSVDISGANTNNIMELAKNGTNVAIVDSNGATTFKNASDSASAFQVQNTNGDSLLNVGTSDNSISLLGNSTGDLGTWSTSNNSLPATRYGHGTVYLNGYTYVIGGNDNANNPTATVYYAKVNQDGSTDTWGATTSMPANKLRAGAVAANGYIYAVGGAIGPSTTGTSTVYYAKQNSNGTLGAWQTASNAIFGGNARIMSQVVTANGFLYVIGGSPNGSTAANTVYYTRINADGSLGVWSSDTDVLPSALYYGTAVVANNRVYVMGGYVGGTPTNNVYYSTLDPNDGSVGSWTTLTGSMPAARVEAASVVHNGYVYVIGGNFGGYQSTVYYAKINSAGSLGGWQSDTDLLPDARGAASSFTANGYIYAIGGYSGTSQSTVYYASGPRVSVGGSLDLVGLQQPASLANGDSDIGAGSMGGSITAGNGIFVGGLQVQGAASIASLAVKNSLSIQGSVSFWNDTDSDNAFEVKNASGESMLKVDTTHGFVIIGSESGVFSGARASLLFGDDCGGSLECISIFEGAEIATGTPGDTDVLQLNGGGGIRFTTGYDLGSGVMVITDLSRVGIGTESPTETLTVSGNFNVQNTGSLTKQYRFRTSGGALDFEGAGASMYLSVWSGAGFTGTQYNHIRMDSSSATMWFPVVTAINSSTYNVLCIHPTNKDVKVGNNAGACNSSSLRYKTDVQNIPERMGLEVINALRPVTFKYKEGDGRTAPGLIAEEVANIFPEAVVYDAQGRPDGVYYEYLVANLIKGIQQQQSQLNNMRVEMDALRRGIWNGGIVSNDTAFNNLVTFNGGVVFKNDATFEGDVNFKKKVTYSEDTAGTVILSEGETRVEVKFKQPYTTAPRIALSSSEFVTLRVIDKTVDGFIVNIRAPFEKDVLIDWVATQVEATVAP